MSACKSFRVEERVSVETVYVIPVSCALKCFMKHFKEEIGYKMVLRQPPSRQQVGILYEMTSPSSLGHASPQTTYVQRHAGRQCATTQTTSIKCCPNLGAIFEALHQYGTTYLYKIPFSQAVANASNLMHWRNDVQLLNYSMYKPLYAGSIRQYMGGLPQKEITFWRQNKEHFQQSSSTVSFFWYVLFYLIKAFSFLNSLFSVLEKTNKKYIFTPFFQVFTAFDSTMFDGGDGHGKTQKKNVFSINGCFLFSPTATDRLPVRLYCILS